MTLIAQDGTRYAFDETTTVEISLFDDYDEPDEEYWRATADLKFQIKVGGEWITIAEYDTPEEFGYVLSCFDTVLGFQPRYQFPAWGFYAQYCSATE